MFGGVPSVVFERELAPGMHFSAGCSAGQYKKVRASQMLGVTVVIALNDEQKLLARKAEWESRGSISVKTYLRHAAEIFNSDMRAEILGAQNAITNAGGIIFSSELRRISFVIRKKDLEQNLVGHPRTRVLFINGVDEPLVKGKPAIAHAP